MLESTVRLLSGLVDFSFRSVLAGYLKRDFRKRGFWSARRLSEDRYFAFVGWTPVWHEGHGPYLSIGLWWFAIHRGY